VRSFSSQANCQVTSHCQALPSIGHTRSVTLAQWPNTQPRSQALPIPDTPERAWPRCAGFQRRLRGILRLCQPIRDKGMTRSVVGPLQIVPAFNSAAEPSEPVVLVPQRQLASQIEARRVNLPGLRFSNRAEKPETADILRSNSRNATGRSPELRKRLELLAI